MEIKTLDEIGFNFAHGTVSAEKMPDIVSGPEPGLVGACQHYGQNPTGGKGQPFSEYPNLKEVVNRVSLTKIWGKGMGPEWADLRLSNVFPNAFEACIHCAGIVRQLLQIASGGERESLTTDLIQSTCAALKAVSLNGYNSLASKLGESWLTLAGESPHSSIRGSTDLLNRSRLIDRVFEVIDIAIADGNLRFESSVCPPVHNTPFLHDLTRWIAGLDQIPDKNPRLVAFSVAYSDGLKDENAEVQSVSGNEVPGDVYHFVFESVAGGSGCVYLNPRQMFLGLAQDFVNGVFDTAAEAARASLDGDSPFRSVRVSIRKVAKETKEWEFPPLLFDRAISGKSATGAAALGLLHTWRGTFPDSDLVVLAEIDEYGKLGPVGSLEKKAKAIARHCPGWTAVVPDKNSESKLQESCEGRFFVKVC